MRPPMSLARSLARAGGGRSSGRGRSSRYKLVTLLGSAEGINSPCFVSCVAVSLCVMSVWRRVVWCSSAAPSRAPRLPCVSNRKGKRLLNSLRFTSGFAMMTRVRQPCNTGSAQERD